MKKYLPISLAGVSILFAATALFNRNSSAEYSPRVSNKQGKSEPYSMAWAKVNQLTGEVNPQDRNSAWQEFKASPKGASRGADLNLTFENKGPDNVGGRTRAILEVYGDPETMLAGSVSGGLFISYDGGGNWEPHNQFQNLDESSSMISTIHQTILDDGNGTLTGGRIYIGTGCSFDDPWPGFGVFYSDDGGLTFKHLEATTPDNRNSTGGPWIYVNRITSDAAGIVYAATNFGLMRSNDKGVTWENVIFLGNTTIPNTNEFADVIAQSTGRVYAAQSSGGLFMSPTGLAGTFNIQNANGLPSSGIGRVVLSYSEQNEDHIYALYNTGSDGGCLDGVYETTNGGKLWTKLISQYGEFRPMYNGRYCQGYYDAAIAVAPLDENFFFLGGITLWRYDGNLTRTAGEFGRPPFQDAFDNYVHADKHYAYFSPNKKSRAYITSDGGISRTEDYGKTWQGLNKGYYTTQFYDVAHSTETNLQIGGTQDNGTLIVLGSNEADSKVGFSITGNDGLHCDMSQMSGVIFTSAQNGDVWRVDASQGDQQGNFPTSKISNSSETGLFHSIVRFWESQNDPTSQDSIIFKAAPLELAFDVSNGVVKNYNATIIPVQKSAIVISSSIRVFSGTQVLTVSPSDSTKLIGGASTGSITYNENGTFNVDVTFGAAPSENSNIYVSFSQRFKANAVIVLESQNLKTGTYTYTFEYRLENDMNPGDEIKVQDPVQTLLASTGGKAVQSGIRMYRNLLNFTAPPTPIDIPLITGNVTAVDFTNDGDIAFIGTQGGAVFKLSGLQQLYTVADVSKLSVSTLNTQGAGPITDLILDKSDNNRLLVTTGGYGSADGVLYSENALGAGTLKNIHGNLPNMPVYTAAFERNDRNIALVGTEFGLWATSSLTETVPEWLDKNDQLSYVPIYAMEQQELPWHKAKNTGTYFIGSFGRGFWQTSSLVGVKEVESLPKENDAFTGLKVYPNPINGFGNMELESSYSGSVKVMIYDINGREIKQWNEQVTQGSNLIQLNTIGMKSGNYYAIVQAGESRKMAKLMVMN